MLGRVSLVLVGAFEPETLWLNRFEGFDKNCVKPEEGDVDRETAGKGGAFGLSESVIGSFVKPFAGFCSVHVAHARSGPRKRKTYQNVVKATPPPNS